MASYIFQRLLLMIPTLLGILLLSFIIIQFVPGGPVEKMIAELQGHGSDATARFSGGGSDSGTGGGNMSASTGQSSQYRGAQGLDPEFIAELEALYGFDKPAHERFLLMVGALILGRAITAMSASLGWCWKKCRSPYRLASGQP